MNRDAAVATDRVGVFEAVGHQFRHQYANPARDFRDKFDGIGFEVDRGDKRRRFARPSRALVPLNLC